MLLAPPCAAPTLARIEGRDLHVLGADHAALVVVEHRPVDGAGQVVFGELGRRARVDDGRRSESSRAMASAAAMLARLIAAPCCARGSLGGRRSCRRRSASSSSLSICDLRPVVLQLRAVDQEGVFDALAQRADLGQLQVDVVARQHAGDAVEQARRGRWRLTLSSQRCARSSGRSVDARRDREAAARGATRGRAAARAAGRSAASACASCVSTSEIRSR